MNVSVVCNTCNRANHLRRLLQALSRQTYEDFEVIVVNGPSEDDTEIVLKDYEDIVKTASCPVRRLGVSRNIGIRNVAGDICVFIDDDAVPGNKYWLEKIVDCYRNPAVGGVGGPVYNLQGGTQFKNGYVDVWGIPHSIRSHNGDFNDSKGMYFNVLMGCNCSFRTSVLDEVHGFDEYYDYFNDEADLSVRIIKAGYSIVHNSEAFVFHELALGHIRKDNYHLDWYTIMRSQAYFGIINSVDYLDDLNEREIQVKKAAESRLLDFQRSYERGDIDEKDLTSFKEMWKRGIEDGLKAGKEGKRQLLKERDNSSFKKYKKDFFDDRLNIVLLCEGFSINESKDGIACYTARLAREYAAMGHCVHVVTTGSEASFNLIDNINVHIVSTEDKRYQLPEDSKLSNKMMSNSYEIMKKVVQLNFVFHIDIVESPLWNSLGLITTYMAPNIPVCVRLETPLKKVIETQKWTESSELRLLEDMETCFINRADGLLHISEAIRETIEDLYDVHIEEKSKKNHLGIESGKYISNTQNSSIKVLFVGRLERRKGIHNLLSIIPNVLEQYPNVEFRIAGDDSIVDNMLMKTFKEDFENKTKNKYINKVFFLGKISNVEKEKELQCCDIFVAPSLYESFGIVFLEAMRYGKPVIGCSIGGMKEIIEDEISGLLTTPDSVEELESALNRLISDETLRIKLGKGAYLSTEDKFNSRKQAEEAIDLYRNIISKKRKCEPEAIEQLIHNTILFREKKLAEIRNNIGGRYVFPWKSICPEDKIVIYGGGMVGKSYVKQIEETSYCNIVAICDRNPDGVEGVNVPVISLNELNAMDDESYNRIVVAILDEKTAASIISALENAGISRDRIVWDNTIRQYE